MAPGVDDKSLLRARGAIYGTKDAGNLVATFSAKMQAHGWTHSIYEGALLIMRDESGRCAGFLVTHVDALFAGGCGPKYEKSLEELAKEVRLTFEKPLFRYCGKQVDQKASFASSFPRQMWPSVWRHRCAAEPGEQHPTTRWRPAR